jgi:glycosyltransferase involved in cell wall biosynthesis
MGEDFRRPDCGINRVIKMGITISVIICTFTERRWETLVTAIQSVHRQTALPLEIIIVVDHNADLLERVRRQITNVLAIDNRGAKGLSGARNSGALVARGAVLAFLDDDAIAEPIWIEKIMESYSDRSVLGVSGKIVPIWSSARPAWFPDEFAWVVGCTYRGMPNARSVVRNMIGANMSVRREVLISAGGFRGSFGCNHTEPGKGGHAGFRWLEHHAGDEETEFCIRVARQRPGTKWFYNPEAVVGHRVSPQRARWRYFIWRCYDEGLGKAMLVGLHGAQRGLASERSYACKILPLGVVRGFASVLWERDLSGLARAGTIVIGLSTAVVGYVVGTLAGFMPAEGETS